MKKGIYLFYDRLVGQYEFFGCFVNDEVAKRSFKVACQDPHVVANDLELYCIARIDTNNGRIVMVSDDTVISESPVYMLKGENNSDFNNVEV